MRPDDGEPTGELRAGADFTDVTADENPDWRVDLNDDVVGPGTPTASRGGDVTLIWGLPLVRGAVAATAELDGEVVDQAAINEGRFTLIAVDAVHGFGDDLYLEIELWDRAPARAIARREPLRRGAADDEPESGDAESEPEASARTRQPPPSLITRRFGSRAIWRSRSGRGPTVSRRASSGRRSAARPGSPTASR